MGLDVVVEDPRWEELELEPLGLRAWRAVEDHLALPEGLDLVLMGCDDARIAQLNGDFRAKPAPTNILSWPSDERGASAPGATPPLPARAAELGDMAIAYETTLREAETGGIPPDHHITHLIVHGTLHLLGYDHVDDRDGDLMESVEAAILATLGIPDPYGGDGPGSDSDGKD